MKTLYQGIIFLILAGITGVVGWAWNPFALPAVPVQVEGTFSFQDAGAQSIFESEVFDVLYIEDVQGIVEEKTKSSALLNIGGQSVRVAMVEATGLTSFMELGGDGEVLERTFADVHIGDKLSGGVSVSRPGIPYSLSIEGTYKLREDASYDTPYTVLGHRLRIEGTQSLRGALREIIGSPASAHQNWRNDCYHVYGQWVSCGTQNQCIDGSYKNYNTYCAYWGNSGVVYGNSNHYWCDTRLENHGGSCGTRPSVYLSAWPSQVQSGGATMLSWSVSNNASNCWARGNWSGYKSGGNGGNELVPLYGSGVKTFSIYCWNAYGSSPEVSTQVIVTSPPPPTVSLSANPARLTLGNSTRLTWSSANASSCTAWGAWSGSKATNGTYSQNYTPATTGWHQYIITCYNSVGTPAMAYVNVYVDAPPSPTVTISANPSTVSYNGFTDISWSPANATSCQAYQGKDFSGSKSIYGGTQRVYNLTNSQPFSIQCSGATGSPVSSSAYVTVLPPLNTLSVQSNRDGALTPGASIAWVSGTGGTQGTTQYSRTISGDINTTLRAPNSLGVGIFNRWNGCAATSGRDCTVGVSGGSARTITAYYLTPSDSPPSVSNLSGNVQLQSVAPCTTQVHFTWSFSDPEDGATQTGYQVQVDNSASFNSPEFDSGSVTSPSKERYVGVGSPLAFGTTYYWRVRARDSAGQWSAYANGTSFATPTHAAPNPDFSWSPVQPAEGEAAKFIDSSAAYGGATIAAWNWTFENGAPSSSTLQSPSVVFSNTDVNTATLTSIDSSGFSCTISKDVTIQLPLPDIKEIPPFSILSTVLWGIRYSVSMIVGSLF